MLASISPVGEAARGQRWPVTIGAHLLASIAGGAAVGALLGGLGAWTGTASWGRWRLAVLALAALAGALADAHWRERGLPSWRRQVDERWLTTYRGWVYGSGFGLQLGAGVMTIVSSGLTYLALLAALLSGATASGVLIGATFGAVRAAPLVLTGRVRAPHQLQHLHRRLDAATRPVIRTAIAAQLAVGVGAATFAWRGVAS